MAQGTIAVQVAFPAGATALDLAGAVVKGLVLSTPGLPRAELSIQEAADQIGATDYRPVVWNGVPLVFPVGRGGYFPLPAGLQLADKIQLTLTNFGTATASVNLITA